MRVKTCIPTFTLCLLLLSCSPSSEAIQQAVQQTQTQISEMEGLIQTAIVETAQASSTDTQAFEDIPEPTAVTPTRTPAPLKNTIITTYRIIEAIEESGSSLSEWEVEDNDLSSSLRDVALIPGTVDVVASEWEGWSSDGYISITVILFMADTELPPNAVSMFIEGPCDREIEYPDGAYVCGMTVVDSSDIAGHNITGAIVIGPVLAEIEYVIGTFILELNPAWLDVVHHLLAEQRDNLVNAGYGGENSGTGQIQATSLAQRDEPSQPIQTPTSSVGSETTEAPNNASDASQSNPSISLTNGGARSNIDGMEMRLIPEGEFTIGKLDEPGEYYDQPPHAVFLDAYWLDRTEVTNAMFVDFLNKHGNHNSDGYQLYQEIEPVEASLGKRVPTIYIDADEIWKPPEDYEDFPVVNVSWFGATSYCEWAGRRLPTEAEWEKAARGTHGRTFPWGEEEPTCEHANLNLCFNGLVEVGSFPNGVSPYDLYNMAGNAAEWTSDWISEIFVENEVEVNPQGPLTGSHKVVKGGSWFPLQIPGYGNGRADARYGRPPSSFAQGFIGFRCALDVED